MLSRLLAGRHVPLVEFDLLDAKQVDLARLVADCILERSAGVLFAEEQVDRLRIA